MTQMTQMTETHGQPPIDAHDTDARQARPSNVIESRAQSVVVRPAKEDEFEVLMVVLSILFMPAVAAAQADPTRFEVGVQVTATMSSEFDRGDVGVGGRFSWHPDAWVGIESEVALYPRAFPDGVAFSRRRMEGLFGLTLGPVIARVRPFAKLRAGFLHMQRAPQPLACILIFPPPLSCELASGRTLLAFDVGGGIELSMSQRTFARVDAGDRLLRYPGPVFDNNRRVRDAAFFSHDFRFAAGAGLRF